MFYCLLDLSCGECYVISLYFVRFSVGVSVCLVCCVFDSVCELFGETIRNMFGYGFYFVVACYNNNNNICLKSNIQTSSVDYAIMDVFSVGGGGGALLDRPCMVIQLLGSYKSRIMKDA